MVFHSNMKAIQNIGVKWGIKFGIYYIKYIAYIYTLIFNKFNGEFYNYE